jgi:predicted DNA repair protein MutK
MSMLAVQSLKWTLVEVAIVFAWFVFGGFWTITHRDSSGSPLAAKRKGARTGLGFALVGIACAVAVRLVA